MNKSLLIILTLLFSVVTFAQQEKPKFDAAKFERELAQFIKTEACLTSTESQKFFPLYCEMRKKQKTLFEQMRRYRHADLSNEKACEEAIREQDRMDVELKELQQTYHVKFMKIMSASKVLKVIKAEEKFHRQAFKWAAKHK